MASEPRNKTIFTIQEYLASASLPAFRRSSTKVLSTARVQNALPWPQYPVLQKPPGTRTLHHTVRSENIKFVNLVQQYLYSISARRININNYLDEDCPLRLPSTGHVSYDRDDIKFFKQVDNEEQFITLMQDYVLRTVSESLRILRGHEHDSPAAAALQFQRASHLCVAHHGRWDILAVPGTLERPFPFFIFLVSPSEFGIQDMLNFANPRTFEERRVNELDRPVTMDQTLWAVIHDTCKHRGRFFAVSNYTRWAFGELSPNDTVACITFPFEAPLLKSDGTASDAINLGCNVIEMLTFWVNWALKKQDFM
ncbi:hypothetical protein DXG01_012174 [Tephrocybe rancida]|nr:hypothetical protein DXG01_012174 [Tephrocybe rancida]